MSRNDSLAIVINLQSYSSDFQIQIQNSGFPGLSQQKVHKLHVIAIRLNRNCHDFYRGIASLRMSDSVTIDNEISNDLSRKKIDPLLPVVNDDPRSEDKTRIRTKGGGRNSVSFDPKSTLVRPEMRVIVGPKREVLNKPLKHDDVVVVPDFFCEEDNWEIYYKLVEEIREINNVSDADWVSWHEGAHLIAKNYESSPTFKMVQEKISKYFGIENRSVGTRLNWYRDSSDWKPFHHDSAAYNAQRAKNQNITVGVSFGAARELSFLHAESDHRIYFPQVITCALVCTISILSEICIFLFIHMNSI